MIFQFRYFYFLSDTATDNQDILLRSGSCFGFLQIKLYFKLTRVQTLFLRKYAMSFAQIFFFIPKSLMKENSLIKVFIKKVNVIICALLLIAKYRNQSNIFEKLNNIHMSQASLAEPPQDLLLHWHRNILCRVIFNSKLLELRFLYIIYE